MDDFKRLDELAKEMAQRDYLIKKRKQIAEALNALTHEEIRLQSQLKKETSDYKKLEGMSIKRLLAQFSDNYESMMDKEYREMKIAEYKHQSLLDQMKNYQDEISRINELLEHYKDLDQEYNTLLNAKRHWATQKGIYVIDSYDSEIRNLKSRQTEIDEAMEACKRLINSLGSAKEGLSSAKGWGMLDILGGGLVTSMVKHDHIARASGYIKDASEKAKLLVRELSDLRLYLDIEKMEIDAFSKTFDTFFDNIFSDFTIQDQIDKAYDNICENAKVADTLMLKLENMRNETVSCIEVATKKREEVLLSL